MQRAVVLIRAVPDEGQAELVLIAVVDSVVDDSLGSMLVSLYGSLCVSWSIMSRELLTVRVKLEPPSRRMM